jgi:hypothetical protein
MREKANEPPRERQKSFQRCNRKLIPVILDISWRFGFTGRF